MIASGNDRDHSSSWTPVASVDEPSDADLQTDPLPSSHLIAHFDVLHRNQIQAFINSLLVMLLGSYRLGRVALKPRNAVTGWIQCQ